MGKIALAQVAQEPPPPVPSGKISLDQVANESSGGFFDSAGRVLKATGEGFAAAFEGYSPPYNTGTITGNIAQTGRGILDLAGRAIQAPIEAVARGGGQAIEEMGGGQGMAPHTANEAFQRDIRTLADAAGFVAGGSPMVARLPRLAKTAEPAAAEATSVLKQADNVVPETAAAKVADEIAAPQTSKIGLHQVAEEPVIDHAGNINLSRINTPDEIKNLLKETSQTNDEFAAARRGVIPHVETEALAKQLGMTPDELLKRRKGQAFNAEEAVAARNLLTQSADNVFSLASKARGGSDADVVAYQQALVRHAAIQEQVSGLTAEAGRALSSFNIKAGKQNVDALKALIERNGGRARIEELADATTMLRPEELATFAKNFNKATTGSKIRELWVNSILSGLRSHAANIASNTLTLFGQLPEHAAAAAIGKFHGGQKVYLSEVGARGFGYMRGAVDGLIAAKRAFMTETPSDLAGKVEGMKAIGGTTGKIVRIPSRFLMAEDELFKSMAYRGEINAQAVMKAKQEKLTGEQFARRVDELAANPTDDMMEAATKHAEYVTFQTPLGKAGQSLMLWRDGTPASFLVLPFIRTPANILKFAAERSPFGLVMKEVRANLAGRNGNRARDLQAARIALGTSLGTAVASMASQGLISGSGPSDPNAKSLMRASGWQPYSVKIGDKWYSYQRLDPFGMLMGVAADYAELRQEMSQEDADKVAGMIATSVSQNLINKTYLSGLADLAAALNDPDQYGKQLVKQLAGSAIPTIAAHVAQTQDPVLRDTQSFLDQIRSRIPFASQGLPPRRTVFGEPIVREGALGPDLISPIFQSTDKNDPVIKEMVRLKVFPSMPQRNIGHVDLTPEQYSQFVEMAGKPVKQMLDQLVRQPGWDQVPDYSKIELINGLVNKFRDRARQEMMMRYPDILQQQLIKKREQMMSVQSGLTNQGLQ